MIVLCSLRIGLDIFDRADVSFINEDETVERMSPGIALIGG
jgi:hypothetical protein